MIRLTLPLMTGSLPTAVGAATAAAVLAIVATAGLSVLGGEELISSPLSTSTGDSCAPARVGKRAILASQAPFPHESLVVYVPTITVVTERAVESAFQLLQQRARPLHEASEVPENFI